MVMRAVPLLVMGILLLAGPASIALAQSNGDHGMANEVTSQADRAAIEALIAAEDAAWNAGDAAAFCAHALPDVLFTNIVGMHTVGRRPFEAQHARIFSTIYKGSTLRQSSLEVLFVRPDVVIVDTVTAVSGFHGLPPGVQAVDGVLRTRLEQVFVKNDGQWRVASFHNVPINPSVNTGAPPR
jgi:uncharacterized protein (TIGR02246 family)